MKVEELANTSAVLLMQQNNLDCTDTEPAGQNVNMEAVKFHLKSLSVKNQMSRLISLEYGVVTAVSTVVTVI